MRASTSLATTALFSSLAAAGNAPAISNNPAGVEYTATFVASTANNITGYVKAAAAPNGAGTNFQVDFYNLPGGNISTSSIPLVENGKMEQREEGRTITRNRTLE